VQADQAKALEMFTKGEGGFKEKDLYVFCGGADGNFTAHPKLVAAIDTVALTATLPFPDFAPDYEFVSMRHPTEYPMNEGRIVSSKGLDIEMDAFENYFAEEHVEHSNALHAHRINGGSYHVGPLARLNLNLDRLTPLAREAMEKTGIAFPNNNPFISIVARAVETVLAFEEALQIVDTYRQPIPSYFPVKTKAGEGCHLTEAPRGILYHRYKVDDAGLVKEAHIWAPTSQNLKRIEDDLRAFVPDVLALPLEEATWKCEQLVRNYDPCISCATHFLKLNITNRG
jgi:coenzyme F420-reducing hydrogenase alpha subunit